MRILMLSQFFPPLLGGEELMVGELAEQLVKRGHDVAVATLAAGDLPRFENYRGARVYRIRGVVQRISLLYKDDVKRQSPPLPDPQLVWELRRVIARERPEIVHAHNWMVHSFLPLKISSGAKLLLSLHDYSFLCPTKKLVYRGCYDTPCSGPGLAKCIGCGAQHYGTIKALATVTAKRTMGVVERNLVDLFLPVSEATAAGNQLDRLGLPYEILPNFMPKTKPETSDKVDCYLDQLPSEPFLMFAGAFARYKGLDTLIDAYRGLDDPPPLVLAGYQTAEYPMSAEDIPENVTVLFDWPHAAVMKAWERCRIGVVPSRSAETFGVVALEAMMVGRPVIASRIGGLPEVVSDGETGILVEPGQSKALREAMQRLITDPESAERMGDAGRARATRLFSSDVVISRLEDLYNDVISGSPVGIAGQSLL